MSKDHILNAQSAIYEVNKLKAIEYIKTRYIQIWNEYNLIFNLSGLEIPELYITDSKSGTAGLAYYNKKRIDLNVRYAIIAGKEFDQTIYHEFAHIIQFHLYPSAKQAHGPEFRFILNSLNRKGNTYHRYNVAAAKKLPIKMLLADQISDEEF